jgi:cullin-5
MKWAEAKLREEEQRALKYLETSAATIGILPLTSGPAHTVSAAASAMISSSSVQNLVDSCVSVLVTSHKETILSECADMIRANETEKLQLMFKLMDRVPDEGIAPMLSDLEAHIYANGIADMIESADVITQDSEKYVEKLLALFRRFSQLVSDAFR